MNTREYAKFPFQLNKIKKKKKERKKSQLSFIFWSHIKKKKGSVPGEWSLMQFKKGGDALTSSHRETSMRRRLGKSGTGVAVADTSGMSVKWQDLGKVQNLTLYGKSNENIQNLLRIYGGKK